MSEILFQYIFTFQWKHQSVLNLQHFYCFQSYLYLLGRELPLEGVVTCLSPRRSRAYMNSCNVRRPVLPKRRLLKKIIGVLMYSSCENTSHKALL